MWTGRGQGIYKGTGRGGLRYLPVYNTADELVAIR